MNRMQSLKNGWNLFRKDKLGLLGLSILLFFILMALFAPLMPRINSIYKPMTGFDPEVSGSFPPSKTHFLGTDYLGRDILSQLMKGAQIALAVGLTAAFTSVLIGTVIGLVSGYFGRLTDTILMRITDIMLTLPGLPLIIVIASAIGKQSVWIIVIIIAILGWPSTARVIRAQVLSLRERPFIEAAKVAGASSPRIIFRHITPNILPLSFLYMTFGVTGAILAEAGLSFIGLGDPSVVSWGMMLQWCFTTGHTFRAPYWVLPPGLCLSLLTFAFYLIGRALDGIINPRLRETK
ncbi:ABC transporter permease [bacterium]|nr:ABC transporter permease [bacterium]